MKKLWTGKLAILVLAFSGVLSLSGWAQTTDDGSGPTEQPSAPMEVGQDQQPADSGVDAQADVDSANAQPPDAQPNDAQPSEAQPTEAQPGGPTGEAPARTDQGVARISLMHGDVSTQRGDSGDWSAATLNQPVMTGDKVSTAEGGRAEVQLDFANTLRLGRIPRPMSRISLARIFKFSSARAFSITPFPRIVRRNRKSTRLMSRFILRTMMMCSALKCARTVTRS